MANKTLIISIVSGPHFLSHLKFSHFTTQMYFQTHPIHLSQQQREQDKQKNDFLSILSIFFFLISCQYEAKVSNQLIACEVEAFQLN